MSNVVLGTAFVLPGVYQSGEKPKTKVARHSEDALRIGLPENRLRSPQDVFSQTCRSSRRDDK